MYVRVVRFTDVTPDRVEGLLARIEEEGGPPPGVPVTGLQLVTVSPSTARTRAEGSAA